MIRVGEAVPGRDDFQLFRYEFNDVTADMTLDVVGGDDRVDDLHLQIVDRPELVGMEVECVYPEYLGRPSRRLPITGGMRIPEGTQAHAPRRRHQTAHRSSRPQFERAASRSHWPTRRSRSGKIRWDYGTLAADDVLTIHVTDSDGVACREPYRVSLSVIPDELPQVAVRLAGIGTAITPDAILPLVGKVSDDYGLDRIWCELPGGRRPGSRAAARSPARRAARPDRARRLRHPRPGRTHR